MEFCTPIMESAKEVDASEVDSRGFYPARDENVYLNHPVWPYAHEPIRFSREIDFQLAIDLAVQKKTVISFPCSRSNKEIREAKVDWKECDASKTHPGADFVHICLHSINEELFDYAG